MNPHTGSAFGEKEVSKQKYRRYSHKPPSFVRHTAMEDYIVHPYTPIGYRRQQHGKGRSQQNEETKQSTTLVGRFGSIRTGEGRSSLSFLGKHPTGILVVVIVFIRGLSIFFPFVR